MPDDVPFQSFPSVEAAVASFREMLPLLYLVKVAGPGNDPAMYAYTMKMLSFLESDQLETTLRKLAKPDGTVAFTVTAEAAEYWNVQNSHV